MKEKQLRRQVERKCPKCGRTPFPGGTWCQDLQCPLVNWNEDASHENGNYSCRCVSCGCEFIGHKRRVTCKLCASAPSTTPQKTEDADMWRMHARSFDEFLRELYAIMIDPCAEGSIKRDDVMQALKDAALRDREHASTPSAQQRAEAERLAARICVDERTVTCPIMHVSRERLLELLGHFLHEGSLPSATPCSGELPFSLPVYVGNEHQGIHTVFAADHAIVAECCHKGVVEILVRFFNRDSAVKPETAEPLLAQIEILTVERDAALARIEEMEEEARHA